MSNKIIIFKKSLLPSSVIGLFFSVFIALTYLIIILPDGFIAGTSSYWLTQQDDVTQYIAGFNTFFSESWHFPLFKIESINYPIGTRSTFADIIPIYSLLLKLLVPQNFFPFNPFGYWIAFSYIMNAVSGWLILKYLRISSWAALITLITFLVVFPALSARLGHVSLMSHWLILLSFVLYIRSLHNPLQIIAWSFLLFIAFYVNIYIFVMVFSIYSASMINSWSKLSVRQNLKQLVVPLGILMASMFITLLPLPVSGIAQDTGWGYYSMNLLSPFTGGNFFQLIYPEVPGQYEGFNYLGLGVIILSIYAYILQRKFDKDFFSRHRVFVILLGLFSVYALSNHIYFGSVHIIDIDYPGILDPLVNQFRASGRFFWPVGYAVTIFAVVMVIKHNQKTGAFILLVVLLFQLVDLRDRIKIFRDTAGRKAEKIIEQNTWNNKIGERSHLYVYPKFRCSKNSSPHHTVLPVMLYASQTGKKLNTGYIARYQPECNDIGNEIANSDIHHSAYIFVKDEIKLKELLPLYFPASSNMMCDELDFAYLCQESTSAKNNNVVTLPLNHQIFLSQVGKFLESGIVSTHEKGCLIYGPYITLPAGNYQIKVLGSAKKIANAVFDVVSENGHNKHAEIAMRNIDSRTNLLAEVTISLERDISNTEFRVLIDEDTNITIESIQIERKE